MICQRHLYAYEKANHSPGENIHSACSWQKQNTLLSEFINNYCNSIVKNNNNKESDKQKKYFDRHQKIRHTSGQTAHEKMLNTVGHG